MDGTLYLGDKIFEGTIEFLKTIKSHNKKYLFLTNNSSRSTKEYCEKLNKMGISAIGEEIFTSGEATIIYLKGLGEKNKIYLLGTPGLEKEFEEAGFILTENDPDYVVLGFDKTLTYQKLETACNLIQRGVRFIATHPDFVCPTEGLPIPDCGAMIKLITAATGKEPKVIGKPNTEMINSALTKLGAKPEETAIIGDRYYTDMEMGFRAGLTTILVLSGETKEKDIAKMHKNPDYIFNSVDDIIQYI